MPGYPVPFIKFREDDANGRPLAGGRLYSYVAGTSTPLATYFDQDLAVGHENTNPVILDASGRANVWIQDGVGYKFVLKDFLDNTIWTQDNVQVPSSGGGASSGGGGGTPATQQVPTGTIVPYGGSAAPVGGDWLLCDGSAVAIQTYKALHDVIGSTYGNGNGSTTFNLPDLRGRFPLGMAVGGQVGIALGEKGGQLNHTHQVQNHQHQIPAHQHVVPAHQHTVPRDGWPTQGQQNPGTVGRLYVCAGEYANLAWGDNVTPPIPDQVTLTNKDNVGTITANDGSSTTKEANPAYITLNFIIKT